MVGLRAFLKLYSTPIDMSGWRGVPWLLVVAVITMALPEARAIIFTGLMGGVIIGAFLISVRHKYGSSGPRRGSPIVLFPRPVKLSANNA
jgi:hypothetical protein